MTTNTEQVDSAPPQEVVPAVFPWLRLFVVVAGMFMITLDFFIVNVAVPDIRAELHAAPSAVEFVVAGFSLAYAASMITAGRLGDLYGRRRLLIAGMLLFTVASLVGGAAPDTGVLIAARVAQGIGAAVMSPQMLAILNTSFVGTHRVRAFTAFALSIGVGATFGQFIGGVLMGLDIAGLGWRTIFLINVPIGIVVLLLTPRAVAESRGAGRTGLDLVGVVLATSGMLAIALPLIEGREHGWPLWCWLCLIASVPLLGLFVAHQARTERRGRAPLVSLTLFHDRAFSVGVLIILGFFSTMASFFLVLALYLQVGHGLTPLRAGLLFGALGLGYIIATVTAPRMAMRLGKQVLTVGALIVAFGYGLEVCVVHAIGTTGSPSWLIPGLFVAGFGMGMFMNPVTPTVLAGVEPDHAAAAAGVLSTAQEGGNAFGVAIIGVVFFGMLGSGLGRYATAFEWSVTALALITAAVAVLVQFLPVPSAAPASVEAEPAVA